MIITKNIAVVMRKLDNIMILSHNCLINNCCENNSLISTKNSIKYPQNSVFNNSRKSKSFNSIGYNLVILSIIILIMGVIMTAIIGLYDVSNIERRTKITEDKFKVINTALVSYLARNGRLP